LLQVQAQFADLLAWLHQDSGTFGQAQYWLDRALDCSHMAGHAEGIVFILARKSQLAGDMHDANQAVDVAEAAIRHAQPHHMRSASMAATYAAHGHALQGDKAACQRSYDRAYELLAREENDPDTSYGLALNEAYIDVHRAHSLAIVGDYVPAFEAYHHAISALPSNYHRDRGVYLVRKAVAHADAAASERGDVSENAYEAASAGIQSLAIGAETNSVRIVTGLVTLTGKLKPWHAVPRVKEFREAMNDLRPMLVDRTANLPKEE
jgi:tetratricopeptide (TPR) repeat protein